MQIEARLMQKRLVAGTAAVTHGRFVETKRGIRVGLGFYLGFQAFNSHLIPIQKGWCAFGKVKILQKGRNVSMAASENPQKEAVRVWLGSGSASRHALMKEIMEEYGELMTFMGKVSADIDEKAIRYDDPRQLVLALAHAKADAILEKENGFGGEDGYLITCDQVVLHKGCILEKPEDEGEARRMIAGYAEAPASTVGSTVVTHVRTGKRVERVDIATILFSKDGLPQDTVDYLIDEGEIFWCAGGLMVEHDKVQPHVVSIEGGIDAVMGLRKETVVDLLRACAAET